MVLEHLVGARREAAAPYETFAKALRLGELPNTYVKVPGLGEISKRPSVLRRQFRFDETPPFIEMVYEAFGPRRMMWGSDYPHDEGTFPNSREVIERTFKDIPEDEKWKIVGGNAARVYHLD